MKWCPPDDYKPIRGVASYLIRMETPLEGSAEEKLLSLVYDRKLPKEVGMTPKMARSLIDRRLVPTGLYPSMLKIAMDSTSSVGKIGAEGKTTKPSEK